MLDFSSCVYYLTDTICRSFFVSQNDAFARDSG